MLEPIDIDINMNQNVSEEAGKAAAASEEATKSLDSMQKEIERLNKVVVDMSTALGEQRKQIEAGGDEMAEYAKKVEASQTALEKAEKELGVYQGTAEQMNKAVQEGADVTNVLSEAREGLASTEAALIDNAGELVNNQKNINEALEYGKKNTEVYSASNKVASASIKGICDVLGIENTLVKNSIGNIRVIAGAKQAWRNSVVLLNKELGITIAQAKIALGISLAIGIGAVVAAVGLAVYIYREYTKEQRIANKLLEEERKLNREAAAAVQEKVSRVQILDRVLSDSNRTYNERNNALKQLKSIMPGYNAQLTKEGELIRDNTGALQKYIDKLLDQELAKRTISKLADAKTAYREWEDSLTPLVKTNMGRSNADIDNITNDKTRRAGLRLQRDTQLAQQKKLNDEIERLEKLAQGYVSSDATTVQDNTKGYWEEQRKQAEDLLATMTDLEKGSKKWNDAVAKYKEAEGKLKAWDFKEKKPKTPKISPEEKASTTLEKKAYDYQKRIDAARVAVIHDGAEKERQAAKAEYGQTQSFIAKELKGISQLEKKTGKPAAQERTMLLGLDVESTRQYEAELGRINAQAKATLNEIFTEVNARFASELDQNLADINRYYDQLIKEATKAGATIDEVNSLQDAREQDKDRAGIHDQLRQVDLDEALEMEKANNLASIGLTTIAEEAKLEIAKKYLRERIDLLRKLGDESSKKEANVLEVRLKGKQSSPKSISGLVNGAIFNKLKKGFENTGLSAEEAQDKTSALFDSFQSGGALAADVIGNMQGMFGGLDEGLDSAMDAMGNIAEGFASGGPLGAAMAVVSEGIKMFSQYAEVDKQHQEALRKLALAKVELQREYNLLVLKEQLAYKTGTNIFGTDQIRGAINSIETYRDTLVKLREDMKGDRPDDSMLEKWEKQLNSKIPQVASSAQARIDKYKKELEAYNKGIGALANVDIVTGSRKSGSLWWRKQKDTYSKLLDTYNDVIDKEGKLNTNRIQAILNAHKMSDENKALLESLLAISEAVDEASQQLKDYLSDTFGVLGDSLADSIVTAFASGEDAAQLFKGNVTDVLNDIAKQMIFGLYLKDTFDKLEKDIHNAYEDLADDKLTEQQLSEKITNILGGFFGGLDGDIDKANKFLEEFWKNAEANGFDRPEGERQGATGGLTNASQDSVNEGVGLLYGVRQMLGDIRQDNWEELLVQRTIMGQISLLVERSEYWEYLKELPNVVKKLDSIESYGLKLKV